MKTATLPPIRLDPKLKKTLEASLEPGETLSSFLLQAAVKSAEIRHAQREYVARAEARSRAAHRTGRTVPAAAVFKRLEQALARAKKRAR
ncbi:MAG: YlcI/YnfO family protein [Myxococcales bacterium]|nr:YlcI/YnfO family protein [Myxococcales bacterium]